VHPYFSPVIEANDKKKMSGSQIAPVGNLGKFADGLEVKKK